MKRALRRTSAAEKYFDIVMQQSGITPAAAVLVTTVQSIRNQGEGDLERGLPNLGRHIDNLKSFGVPTIAAINRFPNDTDADLKRLEAYCAEHGTPTALSEAFTKGGPGAKELAEKVVELIAKNPAPAVRPAYELDEPIVEKIQKVARKIYGASDVSFSDQAKAKLAAVLGMGLRETSCLHCKNAIFLHGRSQNPWRAHWMDIARNGCIALGWSRIYRGHVRQHHADAGSTESLASRIDRRG